MTTYLWWPYPTPVGLDALNAIAPAFGVRDTIHDAGVAPSQVYGTIFKIQPVEGPALGGGLPPAPLTQVIGNVGNDATNINLVDGDSIYIVGHCSAGIARLIGEYASVPVVVPNDALDYTEFRIPEKLEGAKNNIEIGDFLTLLEKFSQPFLPVNPAGGKQFEFQVFFNRGVVRIYAPVAITKTSTTIVGGQLTLSNAERQYVMGQHVDKFSREAKQAGDFDKTAAALAYGIRDRFHPTGGCTAEVILWACFSAKGKKGEESLAQAVKDQMKLNSIGLQSIKVFGCMGKAGTKARSTPTGPILRITDENDTWQPSTKDWNLMEIR